MYLFYEMRARQRALIVTSILDSSYIEHVLKNNTPSRPSDADTTIGGSGTQTYRYLPVERFHSVGRLTDDVEQTAKRLVATVFGTKGTPTCAQDYEQRRL